MVDVPSATIWAPKGEPGDKGPDGDKGPTGDQGPVGPPGPGAEEFVAFVESLENSTDPAKGTAQIARSIQVVQTIADLKLLLKTSASKYAMTLGYYNPGDLGGSFYYLDATDEISTDNFGTLIVAGDGGRWKMWHNGTVAVKQFGLLADWNGTTGTDNTARFSAMLADSNINKILGSPGDYWFGTVTGNTIKFSRTTPLHIDFMQGKILCKESDPTAPFASTCFLAFVNTGNIRVENVIFDDITYSATNNSRGVQPFTIFNTSTGVTSSYTFGNLRIVRGQSILTVASTAPATARAKNITFFGSVSAADTYYGVNLAASGDDFTGNYSVEKFNRCIFVYDVNNVTVVVHAGEGNASSANVLISNKGIVPTQNLDIKVVIESLNGRIDIEGLTTDPGILKFNNVNLDIFVKAIGSNISLTNPPIAIGMWDTGLGGWAASGSYEVTGLNIKFRSALRFSELLRVQTSGAGVAKIEIDMDRFFPTVLNNKGVYFQQGVDRYVIAGSGDLAATPVKVDVAKIFGGVGPQNLFMTMRIVSYNGSVTNSIVAEYRVRASISSGGLYTLVGATQLSQQQSGSYNPTLTVTAPSPFDAIVVGASAGGVAGAVTEVTFYIDEA